MFLRRSSRQGKSHTGVLAPNCWLNQARADSTRAAGGCAAGSNWVRLPAGQAGEVLLQHRSVGVVDGDVADAGRGSQNRAGHGAERTKAGLAHERYSLASF